MKFAHSQDKARDHVYHAAVDLQRRIDTGEFWRETGICNNIEIGGRTRAEYNRAQELFRQALMAWPKWSGDKDYPVPSIHEGQSAPAAYATAEDLWAGEYGALRRELLQHVIDYTRKSNPIWKGE